MMIVLWVTEALPLAVTALIGPILVILFGIAPAREAFAPFADPIIFLFIGSFMLAEAMFVHGLDRRIAYTRPVLACSRPQPLADPGHVRRRDDVHLDVDQQHRDDGHDVSDRPVDRRARRARIACTTRPYGGSRRR